MSSLIADKEETFLMKTKHLKECLEKYEERFGFNDEEAKGAKLHQYCAINIDWEASFIKETLQLLKAKAEQLVPWTSSLQSVLKSIQDRQQQEDNFAPLQSCLSECIHEIRNASQDLSLKAVVKKLESITNDVGLRFDSAGHTGTDYFISSDMFYVEVQLDTSGNVIDVKVQSHSGDPKQCKELIDLLRKRNYKRFQQHLQGLADLYDLKGDTFVKSKILSALEAVENDIYRLASGKRCSNDFSEAIQFGPVGYVTPRHGVNLMQLTYCADPLLLLDEENPGRNKNVASADILPSDFGFSVYIAVESSEIHKLPTMPLLVGGDVASDQYANFDSNNSEDLPATFVMKLNKTLPITTELLEHVHHILHKNEQGGFIHSSSASLDNLVLKQHLDVKESKERSNRIFCQVIGDQHHVCRIRSSSSSSNVALLISRIPFQHPSQVTPLIQVLRRQAVFNLLLMSCCGKGKSSRGLQGKKHYYDIVVSGTTSLTVSFQHPLYVSMASVEFKVDSSAIVNCELHVVPESPVFCSNEYTSKVAQRCLSVPITMRAIIRKASEFVPGNFPVPMRHSSKHNVFSSEKLTLKLPQLHFSDANAVPLVSPGVYSSPALTGFSASSLSPSGSAFSFGLADTSQTVLHTAHPSSIISPSKNRGSPVDSKTSKGRVVPKITIKIKQDGSEYEIDKEKSNMDVIASSSESQLLGTADNEALGVMYSQLGSDAGQDSIQLGGTTPISSDDKASVLPGMGFPYGTSNLPFELTVDGLTAGGVTSMGEIDNLLVPGIDAPSLVGGGLVSQLALPGSAFSQGFGELTGGAENQVEAFDLDAITSGGSQMEFSVDDALSAVSASAIDPSMVVSSSATLPGSAVFDVDPSLIDIDNFMLADQGGADPMDTNDKT